MIEIIAITVLVVLLTAFLVELFDTRDDNDEWDGLQ